MKPTVEDFRDMRVFIDPSSFPVVVYIRNEWEATELSYVKPEQHDSESLCKWCKTHRINYRILFPISIRHFLKHPFAYYRYCRMLARKRKELQYE